jgi:hypothetical protein
LSLTYVDTANNIQFPNSSGTVVLDSGTGVVNSQVCWRLLFLGLFFFFFNYLFHIESGCSFLRSIFVMLFPDDS